MNQRNLAREKLLFRYTNALERGDFATVEAILQEAQHDAELERMIAEINAALSQELPSAKFSARPLLNNHRYNHKDSTMYQNPTFPRTADMPREKRFPYALAAAILAAVLVGGLLITAKFGFDNHGDKNFGGASFPRQNETIITSATPTASMTPSALNPIATGTPTALPNNVNSADITATPLTFSDPNEAPILCQAQTNQADSSDVAHVNLYSRPDGVIVSGIPTGEVVQVLDIGTLTDTVFRFEPPIQQLYYDSIWYFVRWPNTTTQGWVSSEQISILNECPPTRYIYVRYAEGTIVNGNPATLEPPAATAMAATEQAYYEGIGTASAQSQVDSDGDGLTDADESLLGTNPKAWDTDGDDIGDGGEIRSGTNPLNIDTDMDGVPDSQDTYPTIHNDPEATIAAIVQTVTAHAPTATPSVTPSAIFSSTPTVCNPTAPSRLSVGDRGRVIGEGRTGVNLRQSYGFDAPLIRLLDLNTEFEVIDLNAICVEGTNWYKIAIDGEEAGWIPETMWVINDGAASNVYVIEPLD